MTAEGYETYEAYKEREGITKNALSMRLKRGYRGKKLEVVYFPSLNAKLIRK